MRGGGKIAVLAFMLGMGCAPLSAKPIDPKPVVDLRLKTLQQDPESFAMLKAELG